MKMLVTGGAGFIGRGLVKKLLSLDHEVVILDNFHKSEGRSVLDAFPEGSEVSLIDGDVRDRELVFSATEDCDMVWHLAYINGTHKFYTYQDEILEVGVKGTLNTIDAALEHGVKRYIIASSGEVYNDPVNLPTPETERLMIPDVKNPRFSYSGGKIISELLALHYAQVRGLDTVIFRPHNVYGPYMGFGHVVSQLMAKIYKATNGLKESSCTIQIQGSGDETRSYCFIDDLADAVALIGLEGTPGEVYNAGVEDEISIKTLVMRIANVLGVDVDIIPGKVLEGSPARRCPDMCKTGALGFEPKFFMKEGLLQTYDWLREDIEACL